MGTRLDDGTIIMSGLGVQDVAAAPGSGEVSVLSVQMGEVIKALYPEDTGDNEVIYLVSVRTRAGALSGGSALWRCRLATQFEGAADYSRPTLRPATYSEDGKVTRNGSKVLVAAPNGEIKQAFIIGCIKDTKRKKDRPRKKPQHVNREHEAEFNGVHFYVEDDGSFSVEVPGATAQDGTPDRERDENNHGSFVRFDKTGTVTLSDRNGESLIVNPKEKSVTILSGDFTVTASQKATITSKLAMLLQTEETATLDGQRINIGTTSADENLVLGQKLVSALVELADILLNPFVSKNGNLGYPVPANPETLLKVAAWKGKYLLGAPASILAENKFTER